MHEPVRVRAQNVTRIKLRAGLSLDRLRRGFQSMTRLRTWLCATSVEARSMSRVRAPSVIRSGSRFVDVI